MELGLTGKKAIVTAASRGLGKAAAEALAAEGAELAICARSDEIHRTALEIKERHQTNILALQADVSIKEQVDDFIKQAIDQLGGLDILIINAGGPPPGGFLDFNFTDWQNAIDLTLLSAINLCYGVVPTMLEQVSGSIVAMQSYSVKQPIDNLILSNTLRMAVIGLMKSLANELGPRGIRVNSINPGWTWTGRVESLMADRAERVDRLLPSGYRGAG